ncbi:hypothetical protein A2U01_0097828, partial [Trifolium medium]|nr:hypothetical protein [Trifolium medium]
MAEVISGAVVTGGRCSDHEI